MLIEPGEREQHCLEELYRASLTATLQVLVRFLAIALSLAMSFLSAEMELVARDSWSSCLGSCRFGTSGSACLNHLKRLLTSLQMQWLPPCYGLGVALVDYKGSCY